MKKVFSDAVESHLAWTQAFADAIGKAEVSEAIRLCGYDDLCTFGKWLYGLDDAVKLDPAYRRTKDLHYRFHVEAAQIADLMLVLQFEQAKQALHGAFARASAELVEAIRAWEATVDADGMPGVAPAP